MVLRAIAMVVIRKDGGRNLVKQDALRSVNSLGL
jgi:hypothetical protein